MKTAIIISIPVAIIIGGISMYFGLRHMNVNEICITIFFLCLLMAFIAGSLVRSTMAYDAKKNCKHEKFIGDVCAGCGYTYDSSAKGPDGISKVEL